MIRKLQKKDLHQLKSIIDKVDLFTIEEKDVALELIDEATEFSEKDYYNIFVYERNNKIYGYHCTGKRALTDGVFDLYWIVVDPENQNNGIGKELLMHSEEFVKNNNGRWILAETSSREAYESTRKFYLRNNYSIVSQIKDFYSVNDHLIVFGKYIII
ncbi:MAG: GNAT family N-acetyltransferase [Ignavibacteria bacterium RBG_13_36_8]|nr:MAG: GNAT family N-acetyltransferase [Ignavibacteria bacterium RBG_13_36_8]